LALVVGDDWRFLLFGAADAGGEHLAVHPAEGEQPEVECRGKCVIMETKKEKRNGFFTFRLSNSERKMIERLADHLRRTPSDAVRLIVMDKAQEILEDNDLLLTMGKKTKLYDDQGD
jgi:uncharacterized protein (DUF1778 family)